VTINASFPLKAVRDVTYDVQFRTNLIKLYFYPVASLGEGGGGRRNTRLTLSMGWHPSWKCKYCCGWIYKNIGQTITVSGRWLKGHQLFPWALARFFSGVGKLGVWDKITPSASRNGAPGRVWGEAPRSRRTTGCENNA